MATETRNCQSCKGAFVIEPEDFDFYRKISVPPPTWCPECRLMRRLTWRNERALYKRTCDLCRAKVIAMYPVGTPFPVYCRECWYSDKWDATTYGRAYDFTKPFFTQFHELLRVVPQIALQVSTSPGSEYVNQVANCKNCYLITSGSDNEECLYCYRVLNSRAVIDSAIVRQLDFCYECVNCIESSHVLFGQGVSDSIDLLFCSDVRGSQNCFMSANIRRKKNVFRNEQLSNEEFERRMKDIDTGSYRNLESYRTEFRRLEKSRLHSYMLEKNCPNCTGYGIANATESAYCFNSSNLERCKYGLMVANAKDCYDVNNGCCQMERAYECSTVGVNTSNVKLSADVWPDVRNTAYSQSCRNDVSDLFGCASVRKKQYCILNKQYTKEEYEALVPQIIAHMNTMPYVDARGREYKYGEFFPPELSLYAYNETPAQDYFPKAKDEVEAAGFRWRIPEHAGYTATLSHADIPDHIRDVGENITEQIIGCAHEGKCNHQCPAVFRVTPVELQFYRRKNIALPRLCPNCRHHERFATTTPYRLWMRECQCAGVSSRSGSWKNSAKHPHGDSPCPQEFETSYAPERPEVVYCEQCYSAEVA